MAEPGGRKWEERNSHGFLDHARYFVPERRRQMDILLDLVADQPENAFFVDLAAGEGLLSLALLERFPACRVLALDRSRAMLKAAVETCRAHAGRFEARSFDLADRSWRGFPDAPHAIVSSLAIHHLDGGEKRQLFRDMHDALRPAGVLAIADMMLPPGETGLAIAARGWDEAVRANAMAIDGDLAAFEEFRRLDWNYFDNPPQHRLDKPSSLADQLAWMKEAGFAEVDCVWFFAGHAIFGGRKL